MFGQQMFQSRASDNDDEINLTPMMNLFVVLIPFLLTSTAFVKLSIINAAVPTIASPSDMDPSQSKKELNISIRIENNGFFLSGSGDNLTNQELASVRRTIRAKSRGVMDYANLTATLTSIKRRFPKGKTAMIFPDESISYETIVGTMDAARWAVSKTGSKDRKYLYPNVVVTSLAKVGQ